MSGAATWRVIGSLIISTFNEMVCVSLCEGSSS